MNLNPNTFAIEISNALAATGKDYTTTADDPNEYGTSYKITGPDTPRTLYLTPIDGDLIDMVLYDEKGNTIANGTMFPQATKAITTEELATIIGICL